MPAIETVLSQWLFDLGARGTLGSLFAFFAHYLIYIACALFVWGIWRIRDRYERAYFFGFFLLQEILSWGIIKEAIVRLVYNRQRPFEVVHLDSFLQRATGGAFPSGHMLFMAGLSFVAFEINTRLGWSLFALTLLTGIGRVAVGYHWMTDIIGGILISYTTFLILKHFLIPILKRFGK